VPTEKPKAKEEQPTITTVKPKQEKVVKKAKPECISKPPLSRAEKAKLEDDDAEIAALERKLGLKGKKKKLFEDDDFEGLLDGLDGQVDSVNEKRKRSDYDDFLASKRRQIEASNGAEGLSASDDDQDDQDLSDGSIGENILKHDSDLEATGDGFDGFDDETGIADIANPFSDDDSISSDDFNESDVEDSKPTEKKDKQRENPYVAPIAPNTQLSEKYIPPSMRKRMGNGGEDLSVLRRQLKGLLNRLSESKFANIVHEVEAVYGSNARQRVTTVLIDLLMALLCDKSPLMDTFIILHAGFAAAIYKVIGSHFGAQLLERIVTDFERLYQAELAESSGSKECTNLIALLAELYTFQLVGSNVIFDCIRVFLADFSELNTELLLKLIKNCGSQLRHDDPFSLKDIVILLHKSVAKAGEANLPVRTKFMIEIINDLKNNRVKAGAAASVVAAEQTSRLKKVLGSLANAKATEPLGVSLADIKSSSKEGKWWLVGASWKNDAQGSDTVVEGRTVENDFPTGHDKVIHGDDGSGADLLMLAKQQRMNTDIRRAIFMNIMSAEDYNDAHARLLKLKLKKAQELEIPRVLIHCAGAEDSYNPYYTLIAKQLCSEHRFKWAMQYGLWDLFKRMGEKSDDNDDFDDGIDVEGDEEIDLKRMVNLGRLYGQLVADNSLSLTSLKVCCYRCKVHSDIC
jgi:nucleolar MIF4G domain-containing protein 1